MVFRPDPTIYDGRFNNNAWLQELPKPLTKLTWDNAALVSPSTADRLRLISGDIVDVEAGRPDASHRGLARTGPGSRHADAAPRIRPERAGACRHRYRVRRERAANDRGAGHAQGVELTKTGESYELACTQDHWSLEGRNLFASPPKHSTSRIRSSPRRWKRTASRSRCTRSSSEYEGYAWGMTIDQNVCIGCNACVVACVAENNIPVVGKAQVAERPRDALAAHRSLLHRRHRRTPTRYHQPMPCQQCENALVRGGLPGGATTHSDEGLNDMVYNRCVGTRYCSNNCPYKVRRFNFLLYQDWDTQSLLADAQSRRHGAQPRRDGEVHVLRAAHQPGRASRAKLDDRQIRDGEVAHRLPGGVPDDAIVFGNINDPTAQVTKLKASPRNYSLLAELNTSSADDVPRARAQSEHRAGAGRRPRTRKSDGCTAGAAAAPAGGGRRDRRARGAARAHPAGHRAGAHVRLGHRQDQRHRPDAPDADRLVHRLRASRSCS